MLEIAKLTDARFKIAQTDSDVYGEQMMLKVEDVVHNLPRVLAQIETRLAYIKEHAAHWAAEQRANKSSAQIDEIDARRQSDIGAAAFDHLLADMNPMLSASPDYPLIDQREGLDERRHGDLERAAGRDYDYGMDQVVDAERNLPPTAEQRTDHLSAETVDRILKQHASGRHHRLSRMPDKDKLAANRRVKDSVREVEEENNAPGWLNFLQHLLRRWLRQ
jgi:hypothetical protein